MPEGHLLHRHANEQNKALAGRVVRATSPQGRFDTRPYDGRVVQGVEAIGKHLLYWIENAPAIHVHLGMQGKFLRYDDPAKAPRRSTRLRLATDDVVFDLIAPVRCEPMSKPAVATLRAMLGPDPLRADADRDKAVRRLVAADGPVGAAVLDQRVWAGIGNAWRAELLFLVGLDPNARDIGLDAAERLWDTAVRHLALGRDTGKIVSDPRVPDQRWVYKRYNCRRCGTPVLRWMLASRTAYACPVDQPGCDLSRETSERYRRFQ